jgi:hypothetical protein
MSNKIRYEYLITGIAEDGYPVSEVVDTRSKARFVKNEFKDFYGCKQATIVQRKFSLQTEVVIR